MKRNITLTITLAVIITTISACSFMKGKESDAPQDTDLPASTTQTSTSDTAPDESNTTGENKITLSLYFANEDKSAVVKEMREVAVEDGDMVRAAIEALIEGPSEKNLKRSMPENTRLIESSIDGDTVIVNFSKEFLNANGMAEVIARASLVNTLTDMEGIRKVKILVEGEALIGPSGLPFGELERFELDAQGQPVEGETRAVTLYYGNAEGEALIAEKREAYIYKDEPIEAEVFYELTKAPITRGLNPTIPEGTRVLSVETKDGICHLNLSKEFLENSTGGSAGELMTICSIVNTLTELPGIEKVQFLIEGEIRETYIHMELGEPIERNEDAIAE